MVSNLMTFIGGMLLLWLVQSDSRQKLKRFEHENRLLELRCNTNEMNLKKLFYFREIEKHELDDSLTDEDRQALKEELDADVRSLADRNRYLMDQSLAKRAT